MKWLILTMLIVLQSCATDKTSNTVMKQEDYNKFLSQHNSEEFKKALFEDFGIEFHQLFALTNLPISRFLDYLLASEN